MAERCRITELPNDAYVSTGCESLDDILNGGCMIGSLLEISGVAGAGKTQLMLQLLLQVQLPKKLGGLDGACCYVDTEGHSIMKRLMQMIPSFAAKHGIKEETLLNSIYVEKAFNLEEQIDILQCRLPVLLEEKKVKLVIIDSIAGIFRNVLLDDHESIQARTKMMFGMANCMRILSTEYKAVFVVTNQVTSVMDDNNTTMLRKNKIQPALGLAWSHCVNERIMLHRNTPLLGNNHRASFSNGQGSTVSIREASVLFSTRLPLRSCVFVIDENGIRNVQEKKDDK